MPDFTPDDYQKFVDKMLEPPERGNIDLLVRQLNSEAGEVAGVLTKIDRLAYRIQHRATPHNRDQVVKWRQDLDEFWKKFDKELGDVGFYYAALLAIRAQTINDSQAANILKLTDRASRGTLTSGSGDDR